MPDKKAGGRQGLKIYEALMGMVSLVNDLLLLFFLPLAFGLA
jgi:hypothetical protein